MSDFGELCLVIGDIHIPHRASTINSKFQKMLVPGKMQHILSTGNLCTKEQHAFLKSISPNVHIVKGDFDEVSTLPEQKVVKIGNFKIGLIHGHQVVPWGDIESLASIARKYDVDILISGHTHVNATIEHEGRWFLNPGSLTGAYSPTSSEVIPSFMALGVNGDKAVAYIYELKGDSLDVRTATFSK